MCHYAGVDHQPNSVAGQILELHDKGYSAKEIWLELKQRPGLHNLSRDRVATVLRKVKSRSLDSQRIAEVLEVCLETLALVRELVAERRQKNAAGRIRTIEREIDKRLSSPASTGNFGARP